VAIGTWVLVAVWCRSVGTTWTLELHELDPGMTLGTLVDWISSGMPTCQPPAGRRVSPPAAGEPRTAPLPGFHRRPLHAQSKQHWLPVRRP
jgi:hypothetical protein